MGTDISLYAEKRQDSAWQFIGEMVEDIEYQYYPELANPYRPEDLYEDRNYSLFAILADVRNDEGYECIAPRRGIPDDLSPEIKNYFESLRSDQSYTASLPLDEKQREAWRRCDMDQELRPGWLTLEELVDFDWHGKRIQRYARVDECVAHLFHPERGFPFHEWPQGIECAYSRMDKGSKYCNAIWTETYAEAAGTNFMELLNTFSHKYGASKDVRFVFWFMS